MGGTIAILIMVFMFGGTVAFIIWMARMPEDRAAAQQGEFPARSVAPSVPQTQAGAQLTDRPGEGLAMFGVAVLILGLIVMMSSWFVSTAVQVPASFAFGEYQPAQEVTNLAKMQQQTMILHTGIALLLSGIILYGTGKVLAAINATSGSDYST